MNLHIYLQLSIIIIIIISDEYGSTSPLHYGLEKLLISPNSSVHDTDIGHVGARAIRYTICIQ